MSDETKENVLELDLRDKIEEEDYRRRGTSNFKNSTSEYL